MNGRIFIDTNVLVYAHTDLDSTKQVVAQNLILEHDTWVSTQVLQELSNVLSKKFGKSWKEIDTVLKNVLEGNAIHTNCESTILDACRLAEIYRYSFYDSLIISASLESGCQTLASEDMAAEHVIDKRLTIVNPFQ